MADEKEATGAGVRDALALERTRLANERTLLSYLRTALALLAGGGALLHFFGATAAAQVTAWLLLLSGLGILALGLYRYYRIRARLQGDGSPE